MTAGAQCAEHGMNYTVGIGNDELSKEYSINSLPVSLLIDRKGRIAEAYVGVVDKSKFEEDIRELLGETNIAPSASNK
jgi:hypothetical protein